jgi:hypothetical protein
MEAINCHLADELFRVTIGSSVIAVISSNGVRIRYP